MAGSDLRPGPREVAQRRHVGTGLPSRHRSAQRRPRRRSQQGGGPPDRGVVPGPLRRGEMAEVGVDRADRPGRSATSPRSWWPARPTRSRWARIAERRPAGGRRCRGSVWCAKPTRGSLSSTWLSMIADSEARNVASVAGADRQVVAALAGQSCLPGRGGDVARPIPDQQDLQVKPRRPARGCRAGGRHRPGGNQRSDQAGRGPRRDPAATCAHQEFARVTMPTAAAVSAGRKAPTGNSGLP